MTDTHPLERTIHSDRDLYDRWRRLMGSDGFGRRSLWLIFIDCVGRMLPTVVPVDDIPSEPDMFGLAELVDEVIALCAQDEVTVAVLLARPGPGAMTGQDRRWARALRRELPCSRSPWPVHLATRGRVQVFAPDDVFDTS